LNVKINYTERRFHFWNASFFLILVGLLFRYLISLFPYSGHSKPPMYGDYEVYTFYMLL